MGGMTETALAATAASYGVLMGLAPALQIRRMMRERSSKDVSIGSYVVLAFGFMLWITYGLVIGNMALVIPNSVALTVAIATIGVALGYRRRSAGETST